MTIAAMIVIAPEERWVSKAPSASARISWSPIPDNAMQPPRRASHHTREPCQIPDIPASEKQIFCKRTNQLSSNRSAWRERLVPGHFRYRLALDDLVRSGCRGSQIETKISSHNRPE